MTIVLPRFYSKRRHDHSGGKEGLQTDVTSLPYRGRYYVFDTWGDNRMSERVQMGNEYRPDWIVRNGSWSASSGYLENSVSDGSADIYTTSTKSSGVWELSINNYTLTNNNDTSFFIMSSNLTPTIDGNGYCYRLNPNHADHYLYKYVGGSPTALLSFSYTFTSNKWYKLKIVRDEDGTFEVYLGDELGYDLKGTVTDKTFMSSKYMLIIHSTIGLQTTYYDNLKVY